MTDHDGEEHPGIRTYVLVLVILAVVTLLEVATYFIPWFQEHRVVLFVTLSVMAIGKFALVVGFYMHLRYDALYHRRVFVVPLVLAIAMVGVLTVFTAARYAT